MFRINPVKNQLNWKEDTDNKEMIILKMKRLKGFTLIECIIALFILGISSLLLVQAYGQLMKVTVSSNTENISISKQMADAERRNTAGAKKITVTMTKGFVVTKVKIGSEPEKTLDTSDYTFQVDAYQIQGRNVDGSIASEGSDADSMRYVIFG